MWDGFQQILIKDTPATVSVPENRAVNKTDKVPLSWALYSSWVGEGG